MPSLYITFIDYMSWLFSDDEMKKQPYQYVVRRPLPMYVANAKCNGLNCVPYHKHRQIHMFKFSESTKGPHDVIAFGNRAFREVIKFK